MGQDESTMLNEDTPPERLSERSLSAVAEYINSGEVKRIVVMAGAGISTAAGIPDFRSPKTGLYSNLARLNLPHAEAVFDIDYFRKHPEPFYVLAKELYPGNFHPTISHAFIALLAQKKLLKTLFTQNIDCLDLAAGVPSDNVIAAHGSFATQRCIECKEPFPDKEMREHVEREEVPRCQDSKCNGLVKPDIVFFGEPLPAEFRNNTFHVAMADLVLVIGTSLTVYPFASLPEMISESTPRVLFNMERVGRLGTRADDVLSLGPCDEGIRELARQLGWEDELEKLWRDVVGDKEADKQSSGLSKKDVEHDIQQLADEVEQKLHLERDTASEKSEPDAQSGKEEVPKVAQADDIASSPVAADEATAVKKATDAKSDT